MNLIKRAISFFVIFSVLISVVSVIPASAAYKVSFDVFSDVAYLINTDTNTAIYEKEPDKQTYPASLTKIMTALVAIENVADLENTMVTAPAYVYNEFAGIGVSTADIRQGETLSMLDLLYALILPSACEAGNIIADYVGGGSIPAFVEMMNNKARELGALNTNFANAHGLFDETQVTTARDMAIITQAALKYPVFEEISSSPTYNMPATSFHPNGWTIVHTNYMMSQMRGGSYYYKYVKGVKTGSIPEVGKNLVSTASKDGYNYMLVTMGAPAKDSEGNYWPAGTNKSFDDAIALYDWAFQNFSVQKILKQNEVADEIPVRLAREQDYVTLVSASDVTALLPNDVMSTALQKKHYVPEIVDAPIAKGTKLGTLELNMAGETLATVDLVAAQDIIRNETLYWIDLVKMFLAKPVVIVLLIALTVLVLIYLMVIVRYNRIKRRQQMRRRRSGM